MQTMPFSGTAVHAHTQASLHATTRGAPFILIIFMITMYIPFFIRGRTHTRMPPLFADALSMCQLIMLHAVATIVPAPRCPRACCPLRTSRYVACHARRRCDGPCEWVAFRVRIRMSTHACMPSNVSWRQPPSSAAPLVTLRARHRTVRTGTRRDDNVLENARTDAHGMDCWCRYAPTARLVLRAARDFDALQSANASGMLFDVVTCRETRSSRPSPVFLNTILSRTTVKRWPRERASTLRLGARYALEPAAEPIF